MPFKVQATVVAFLGDTDKYPCHQNYNVGDVITFDGRTLEGNVCPEVLAPLAQKINAIHSAGPRYVEPADYNLFWYAPCSTAAPENKKYDGNGFKPTLESINEPPHTLAALIDPNAFHWPPVQERICLQDVTVICPDARTSAVFKVEAVDLCEFGESAPYFRRSMTIINQLKKKPGMNIKEIEESFTQKQLLEIYPPLTTPMITYLMEEMLCIGYAELKDEKYYATDAAIARLEKFKNDITEEEVEALEL